MIVDPEKCTGCGKCVQDCPLDAISIVEKKAVISLELCVNCQACAKVCPQDALTKEAEALAGRVRCDSCPIGCEIAEGKTGACQRFRNERGILVRIVPLHTFADVQEIVGPECEEVIRHPLITGIGAGTTYPDPRPAPYIVQGKVQGVDVVTVVTEAPLSYSGIKVKIDTDKPIGEEGAPLLIKGKKVGHVTTEEYGSKILSIGGANLLTGENGFTVARLIAQIANRERIQLKVKGGSTLEIQVGEAPVIDGELIHKMRVGCGSASMGLFTTFFKEAADEVIVLDAHLTGLFTEHPAGRFVGARYSGIQLRGRKSTPGRYFEEHGSGWGGTNFTDPLDVIAGVRKEITRIGTTVLITETTGEQAAMFRWNGRRFEQIPLTPAAQKAVEVINKTSQPSRVSAIYTGGAGGSARAGVTIYPIKLTQAVHARKACLTIGGAPTFIYPGGGITFAVDVERVKRGAFTWVPTPATVAPIEYTMRLDDYIEMGGHQEAMKPFDVVVKDLKKVIP
ncbi:MAG: 6-hydroxynicotinate reductase [Deltaproteobacteria bacterium]|nr:MAG: 6-hydroxynicotinate reductase [Deltaproteobacteria bacterium]